MFGNMEFASQLIKMMAFCAGYKENDFSPVINDRGEKSVDSMSCVINYC